MLFANLTNIHRIITCLTSCNDNCNIGWENRIWAFRTFSLCHLLFSLLKLAVIITSSHHSFPSFVFVFFLMDLSVPSLRSFDVKGIDVCFDRVSTAWIHMHWHHHVSPAVKLGTWHIVEDKNYLMQSQVRQSPQPSMHYGLLYMGYHSGRVIVHFSVAFRGYITRWQSFYVSKKSFASGCERFSWIKLIVIQRASFF